MKTIAFAYCVVITTALFLSGCTKTLSPGEFVQWFEDKDNGFVFTQNIDSFSYLLQFRPGDLMALTAFNADQVQDISKLKKDFADAWYFKMNVCEKNKKKDALKTNLVQEADYFKRVYFLSEGIKAKAFLILNTNDTVRCSLHSYERTYNINPCQTILFSFDKKQKSTITKFVLMDEVFTGKPIEFLLNDIDIKEFPKLKL